MRGPTCPIEQQDIQAIVERLDRIIKLLEHGPEVDEESIKRERRLQEIDAREVRDQIYMEGYKDGRDFGKEEK